jgi:hypothetical protein
MLNIPVIGVAGLAVGAAAYYLTRNVQTAAIIVGVHVAAHYVGDKAM